MYVAARAESNALRASESSSLGCGNPPREDAEFVCVCVCVCVWDAGLEVVYPKANFLQLSPKGVSKGNIEEQVFRNLKGKDMFVKGLCERESRNLSLQRV